MLLRFRSKDGMFRVQCDPQDTFGNVLDQLLPQLPPTLNLSTFQVSDKPNGNSESVNNYTTKSIKDMQLNHGDIVYLSYEKNMGENTSVAESDKTVNIKDHVTLNKVAGSQSSGKELLIVKELPIDVELDKEDGLIPRKRSDLCKHGDKGMCEYCSPLPPWDKEYHEENNIKHIAFHSYLKRINQDTNKSNGSSYIQPLSKLNYKIDKNCSNGHEPWPRGICSKCQPSAITLQQQDFRMVDHVEFQKSEIINQFIESWRFTGMQRFGYLYGSYDKYDSTPLGIKAKVECIYEPSQHDEQDGLTMDMESVDKEMERIDNLAKELGLTRIGMIFTDLVDAKNGDGTVFCKRHKDSYFLTSFEAIMMAKHQLKFPNACKYSEQGTFSSKFITCVVSGNLEGEIDISSYQVSEAAEALVDAQFIGGSTHPSMAFINETNNDRYVPELFYMKKNEYRLTVKENAKPAFPVDYLITSSSHGFPKDDNENENVFQTNTGFPWSNRENMGQSQDYEQLRKYILEDALNGNFIELGKKMSNFHFLLYVNSLEILSADEIKLLFQTAVEKDPTKRQEALFKLASTGGWQTLVMILQETL